MKLLLSVFLSCISTLLFSLQLVYAQNEDVDLAAGSQVFSANCLACHAGGQNSVNLDKTLEIEALKKYSKDNIPAIITQVTNGNGAMPAFGDRLSEEDIQNVANYVLNQATSNSW